LLLNDCAGCLNGASQHPNDVAGIVLVLAAPASDARWAAAVFAFTSLMLFGTSAAYHRGTWSPRAAYTRAILATPIVRDWIEDARKEPWSIAKFDQA